MRTASGAALRKRGVGWVGGPPRPPGGLTHNPIPFLGSAPAPSDATALAEATGATQESLTASGREAAYVPVQRGDIFVTGDVMAPLPDTVPQHQLRGAAVAVFIQVPYPGGRVSGPAQGTHPALSARSQSKECPPPLVARLGLPAFIMLLKKKKQKQKHSGFLFPVVGALNHFKCQCIAFHMAEKTAE